MGKLVHLSCPDCAFQFIAKYGIGKTDLTAGTKDFPSEEEKEVGVNFSQYIVDNPHELVFIRNLIREHRPVILKTWEHQPYVCPHCSRLYNRFTYHFLFKGGDYSPAFTCLDCGRVLEKVPLNQTVTCPKCRKRNLQIDSIIPWE